MALEFLQAELELEVKPLLSVLSGTCIFKRRPFQGTLVFKSVKSVVFETGKPDPWLVRHGQRIGPACKPVYTGLHRAILVKTDNSAGFKKTGPEPNRASHPHCLQTSILTLHSHTPYTFTTQPPPVRRRATAELPPLRRPFCGVCSAASVPCCRRVRRAAFAWSFGALPAAGSSAPVASGRLRVSSSPSFCPLLKVEIG
ncbi:hypothetical protein PIB30_000373 [Stylosanthes scabra]|uniref:Uncharacterized protein n=1 Tax=Stylosanthes scabra TaxID=79078 RepID=A0ABU6U3Y2_9FABA|nr:hypothetical protein [Stylosanthes scabra]